MGQRKVLYFMQLCLHYIHLLPKWRNFIFSMLESLSWKNKVVTKMWRLKICWYLSKLLIITTTSLILVTFSTVLQSCKIIWNWNLDWNLIKAMYKVVLEKIYMILTLLQWDFFSRLLMDWGQKGHLPKIFLSYSAMMPQLYLT